ncbi:MAG: hypothetical protein ACPHIB_02760 [Thalassobaculaceae bacterium]
MADRLVIGKANNGTSDVYGLWVSKPGVNVINGSGVLAASEDLLFDSRNPFGQVLKSGIVTVNPDTTTIVSFNARNGQIPPFIWWRSSSTKLTLADVNFYTALTVDVSVTGNSGELQIVNEENNSLTIGYLIWGLDD